jgi:hypothetical protein
VAFNRWDFAGHNLPGEAGAGNHDSVRAQRIAVLIRSNCRKGTNTKDNSCSTSKDSASPNMGTNSSSTDNLRR